MLGVVYFIQSTYYKIAPVIIVCKVLGGLKIANWPTRDHY